ncbi:MAG: hypothetical protein H7A25_00590 [Leptospiraceae bacterium]|nr:hypothetical protein [Leptospiraceae bacterium]MCP5498374.1 hypothetical protein [Leptospiraceae bacterium]
MLVMILQTILYTIILAVMLYLFFKPKKVAEELEAEKERKKEEKKKEEARKKENLPPILNMKVITQKHPLPAHLQTHNEFVPQVGKELGVEKAKLTNKLEAVSKYEPRNQKAQLTPEMLAFMEEFDKMIKGLQDGA